MTNSALYAAMQESPSPKLFLLPVRYAFLLLFGLLAFYIAFSLLLQAAIPSFTLASIFLSQILCFLVPILLLSSLQPPLSQWSVWKRPKLLEILGTLAATFCVVWLIGWWISLQDRIWPLPREIQLFYENLAKTTTAKEMVLKGVVLSITPAFCEEILFRGVFQPSIRQKWGKTWGVLITGFAFAIAHTNPWHFHLYWLLGSFLSLLLEWRGSLWLPILAHFLNNWITLWGAAT